MRCSTVLLAAGLTFAGAAFCADSPQSAPVTGQPAAGNELGLFVDHVSIGVADMDKEAGWYERVMGFKVTPVEHRAEYDLRQILIPGFRIDLLLKKGSTRASSLPMDNDKQGLIRVGFGGHDLEAAYKRLTAQGLKPDVTRRDGQLISIHFNDPEGNGVEIAKR